MVLMKFLMLIGRQESCELSHKNHLFYPIVIESLYLSLLYVFAALLSYTGFQNYSLIRSTICSCSTCCFGSSFEHHHLHDFIKTIRALIKDIFLLRSWKENIDLQLFQIFEEQQGRELKARWKSH